MNHREIVEYLEENTAGDVKTVVLLASGNAWCDWYCGKHEEPGITQEDQAYRYVARALRAAGYVSHLAHAHEVIRRRHCRPLTQRGSYLSDEIVCHNGLFDIEV
jgi:hypothetical protein